MVREMLESGQLMTVRRNCLENLLLDVKVDLHVGQASLLLPEDHDNFSSLLSIFYFS